MTNRTEQVKLYGVALVLGLVSYFGSYATMGLVGIQTARTTSSDSGSSGGFVDGLIDSVRDSIYNAAELGVDMVTNFVMSIITAVGNGIVQTIQGMFRIPVVAVQAVVDWVTAFGDGATNVLDVLFGVELAGPVVAATYTAPFGIPAIGWVISGFFSIGIGFSILQAQDAIPGPDDILLGIAMIFMTSGALMGMWAVAPEQSEIIIAGVMAALVLTTFWTVINVYNDELA